MDVEAMRNLGIDLAQEIEKFASAVPWIAFSDHLAGRDVQRSEKRSRAVPLVVVGPPLRLAGTHGQ
jgi:hypothetical protein